MVQNVAMKTWAEKEQSFLDMLNEDSGIKKYISEDEIKECFDLDKLQAKIDFIFSKIFEM